MQQKMQQWKITLEDLWWKINPEGQHESKRYYMPFVLLFCTWIMLSGIKIHYTIQTTEKAVANAVTQAMTNVVDKTIAEEVAEEVAKILADSGSITNRVISQDEINNLTGDENSKETAQTTDTTETTETDKKTTEIEIVRNSRIFKEPNESSEVLEALDSGEKLIMIEEVGKGWLKVTYNQKEGYVYYYLTDYKKGDKVAKQNNSVKGKTAKTTKICSLREKPGITSKQIKFVSKGEKLKLMSHDKLIKGEEHGWYKVKLANNEIGYIYGDAISIMKGVTITMQKTINMYEKPSETAKVVATIEKGKKVTVTETKKPGWLKVDNIGYVHYLYTNYPEKANKKAIETKKYSEGYGVISGMKVNLRQNPKTTAEVEDCLFIGTEVSILSHVEMISGEEYGWYQIKMQNGEEGYIYGKYIAQGEKANEIKRNSIKQVKRSSSNVTDNSNQTSSNATGGSKETYQQYAKKLCEEQYGWGEDQFSCLVNLWQSESGWDPTATNSTSGAYGIPQALPADKIDEFGNRYDYRVQIAWGLSYIKNRYTNPAGAWSHFCEHNWY